MKPQELRDKTVEELKALLVDLRKKQIETINEIRKTNKNEHPELVTLNKRDIARTLTIIREKEMATTQKQGE